MPIKAKHVLGRKKDLYALKEWKPAEVARALGVNVARVYLTKHRVGTLLKQEIRKLETALL